MRRRSFLGAMLGLALPATADAREALVEPTLHVTAGGSSAPRVALTLDACTGLTDYRILDALIEHRIRATIFATGRWLDHNETAFAQMRKHDSLFRIENHGAHHVPAVLGSEPVYGIAPAGTIAAVEAEVRGGNDAIVARGAPAPAWYRDATAEYSPAAMVAIEKLGYRIAGFSLNADQGASLPTEAVIERLSAARDGDVIIGHINQPTRPSGAGIAIGAALLKARGFSFVWLDDAA